MSLSTARVEKWKIFLPLKFKRKRKIRRKKVYNFSFIRIEKYNLGYILGEFSGVSIVLHGENAKHIYCLFHFEISK